MKRSLLALLLAIWIINCFGQKIDDPLNYQFNDILQRQILDDLEVNVPIVFFGPGVFFYGSYQKSNDNIYFDEKGQSKAYYKKFSEIVENEFAKSFSNKYIKVPKQCSAMVVKAFSDRRHLLNLEYTNNGSSQTLFLELPNKGFSKKNIYEDHILRSSIIEKSGQHYYKNCTLNTDTLIEHTKFNTKKRKYSVTHEKLRDDRIESRTHYKANPNRDARKIKEIEKFEYNENGQLIKVMTIAPNGTVKDSTLYFYKDKLLTSEVWKKSDDYVLTYFKYNGNSLVKEKNILLADEKFMVSYSYNSKQKISGIRISNNDASEKKEI
jgi:hypothetical protein